MDDPSSTERVTNSVVIGMLKAILSSSQRPIRSGDVLRTLRGVKFPVLVAFHQHARLRLFERLASGDRLRHRIPQFFAIADALQNVGPLAELSVAANEVVEIHRGHRSYRLDFVWRD